MLAILSVGIGGGLGAVLRHLLNTAMTGWLGSGFPWGILTINVLGSVIMGVLIGLFAHMGEVLPGQWKLFLTTGILGGFTTFSTFSLDSVLLIEKEQYAAAAGYIVGSVAISVLGLMAAMWSVRQWLT